MIRRLTAVAIAALSLAATARAQTDSVPKTVFVAKDGYVALGFLGASALVSHWDPKIEHWFQDTSLTHVRIGRDLDGFFTHFNETTLTFGGIATWGIGRLIGSDLIADVGLHSTEAVVTASLASQLIRGPLGRSRPQETNFTNQYDFHFLQGFSHFQDRSFPSIHSSSGFAVATVIAAETKRRDAGAFWIVTPIAYAFAMTPGLSRLYLGQHWMSDIFAGAFMGTFAGLKVVGYSHAHPDNFIDRHLLKPASSLQIGMSNGDLTIGWSSAY